ncbi:ABC transporter ATP-binding protein [Spirosoma aerolatum]|uniref:ABC transporter ATP-binding protein n=1 Tax=Spirosoma aerolatum TaxID=1211326 RepID=UPI0009AF0931|nr:ATP-binding cassette domain-containing protein [Spirosoma aerolatum]
MLTTHALTFAYGSNRQFTFPDLQCGDKQSLLILGKSGTGKTTLLHLLAALLKPVSGSIRIDKTELTELSPAQTASFRAAHLGIVYQKPHFVSALTVEDNLLLANYFADRAPKPARAHRLAGQLGLQEHLTKKTSQLSQGEQQRLSLARALMNEPSIILADEPTSSLDDENCNRVIGLLREQSEQAGSSLIVVTHDARLKTQFMNQVLL